MKKLLSILMVIVMAVSLCSCLVAEPEPTEPTEPTEPAAGFEEYTCVYTDERDLDREEDIVYMANVFLTEHPILADVPSLDPSSVVEKEFQAKDFTAEESYGYLVKSFPEYNTVYARTEYTYIYHHEPFCDLRTDVEAALDQTEELKK